MQLEETHCYVCGPLVGSRFYDEENGFKLVKCDGCGLLYLSPRPSQEEITAASKTGQHRGEKVIDLTGHFSEQNVPRYEKILSEFFPGGFASGATWLDIGCGHGEFLVALNNYSNGALQVAGCEPNAGKVASAQQRGLNVSFFDLDTHETQYDYLSLLNVYSHLPDPVQTLKSWSRLLKPNGVLLLQTGHSCHLPAKHHHKPYLLPDHLSFANEPVLRRVLDMAGFEVNEVRKYPHTVFMKRTPRRVLQEVKQLLLGRQHRLHQLFPKEPNRDMYIKSTKRSA